MHRVLGLIALITVLAMGTLMHLSLGGCASRVATSTVPAAETRRPAMPQPAPVVRSHDKPSAPTVAHSPRSNPEASAASFGDALTSDAAVMARGGLDLGRPTRAGGPITAYSFNGGRVHPANQYGIAGRRTFEPGDYVRWVQTNVARDYDFGFRRVYVRGPFGKPQGDPPHQIDSSATLMDDPEWRWVLGDFDAAMREAARTMPDLRFIMHMGSSSPAMRALPSEPEQFARFQRAMAPLIAHDNIDICIDTSAAWRNDQPGWAWIEWVRDQLEPRGRRVYVEALPFVNEPSRSAQMEMDALALATFARFRAPRPADHPRAVRITDPVYENVIWLNGKAAYDEVGGFERFLGDCARYGWTPIVDRWRLGTTTAAEIDAKIAGARAAMIRDGTITETSGL